MHKIFVSTCGLIASAISLICNLCQKSKTIKIKKKMPDSENSKEATPGSFLKSGKKNDKLASASSLINLYSIK